LNTRISTPGVSNDSYQFNFDDSTAAGAHPDWLTLTVDNTTGHYLLTSNNYSDVPKSATTFTLVIKAKSKASGNEVAMTFNNIQIVQTPPQWVAQSQITQSQIVYNDTKTNLPTSVSSLNNWIVTGTDKGLLINRH